MSREWTRRGALKFLGGAAVGTVLSPLPWRGIEDLARWSQNGSLVPKVPRGPVTERTTACTLCPASCGVRARCVAGVPFALGGIPGHPAGGGALCPLGFAGHHLPGHPARLTGSVRRMAAMGLQGCVPIAPSAGVAMLARALVRHRRGGLPGGVAILDPRPGRAISAVYRRFAADLPGGIYVACPPPEEAALETIRSMRTAPTGPLGYDLERARTIVSFGAPLLEGWGGPSRALQLRFPPEGAGLRPRFIQIEPGVSLTSRFADRHLAPRPLTEGALAMGLAHLLLRDAPLDVARLRNEAVDFERGDGRDFRTLVAEFTPERVARVTGLPLEEIVEAAREIGRGRPAVVVSGLPQGNGESPDAAETAVAGLDFLLDAVGRPGGIVSRVEPPEPFLGAAPAGREASRFADIPDGSLSLIILDGAAGGAFPSRAALARKLTSGESLIISFSPYRIGAAADADLVIPAPPWLEGLEEAPTPPGAVRASCGIALPLIPSPSGLLAPVEVLARVSTAARLPRPLAGTPRELLEERARTILVRGDGALYRFADQKWEAVPGGADIPRLLGSLEAGAIWLGPEPIPTPRSPMRLLGPAPDGFERGRELLSTGAAPSPGTAGEEEVTVIPFFPRDLAGNVPVPALASKLDRESGLRPAADEALVHPRTARERGLEEGAAAWIEAGRRRQAVRVRIDPAVRPGIVLVAAGPGPERRGERQDRAPARVVSWTEGAGVDRPFRARIREA